MIHDERKAWLVLAETLYAVGSVSAFRSETLYGFGPNRRNRTFPASGICDLVSYMLDDKVISRRVWNSMLEKVGEVVNYLTTYHGLEDYDPFRPPLRMSRSARAVSLGYLFPEGSWEGRVDFCLVMAGAD